MGKVARWTFAEDENQSMFNVFFKVGFPISSIQTVTILTYIVLRDFILTDRQWMLKLSKFECHAFNVITCKFPLKMKENN